MNNTMNNSIIINFLKEQMKIHKVENSIIILPKNIELLDNLTEKTINNLKRFTDRKIIIHSRRSEIKLDELPFKEK